MTNLRTLLKRAHPAAAEDQDHARETTPMSYRHPEVRPVIAANRIYKRRVRQRYGA